MMKSNVYVMWCLKIDSNNTIAKKIKLITTINTSIKNNV